MYDAAVKAIAATDKAVGVIYEACKANGYVLMITADHGNAEQMKNPDTGAPHTAHTTNPVPFIMTGDGAKGPLKFDKEEPSGKMGYVVKPDGAEEKGEEKKGEEEDEEAGALCDVAPTVLAVMGIEKPEEMTGRSLLAQ